MQPLAWLAIGTIQEHDPIHHLIANKTCFLQSNCGLRKILIIEQDVDIPRIANGSVINSGHPNRHSITANHGITDRRFDLGPSCLLDVQEPVQVQRHQRHHLPRRAFVEILLGYQPLHQIEQLIHIRIFCVAR